MRGPLPWLGALLVVYLAGPVVYFCYRLATTPDRGFHDAGLLPAFWVSIQGATIATTAVTVLGVPLAYLLARRRGPWTALVSLLVQVPLAVPPVMSGILLIYVLGPYTPIGSFFGGRLTESLAGVVLAQTFVCAPFLVVTARAAFGAVDPTLEDVAATLGHGRVRRFASVAVPGAAPGIRAGMVLAWLRAFGEYGATVVLAYHPSSLNVYTYIRFSSVGLPGTVAPTALALGVAVVAVGVSRLVVVRYRRERHGVDVLPAARRPDPPAAAPLCFSVERRVGDFHLSAAHRAEALRLAVLGPSGAGKSVLLRSLAGLTGPAGPGRRRGQGGPGGPGVHGVPGGPAGSGVKGVPGGLPAGAGGNFVAYGEHRVDGVPAERRHIGYVAQGFGLFPHLTVSEQVLFGRDADPAIAAYWLDALRLRGLERRLPSELSGGERQRVAMAQALARSPDVLFLDEPFSALDTPVRVELRSELRALQREAGISTVLVTHDPEEAALLADEIIVVARGRVLQQGRARDVYERPQTPEVAELLGVRNVSPATVDAPGRLSCAGGRLRLDAPTGSLPAGSPVLWRVPPADVVVAAAEGGSRSEGPSADASARAAREGANVLDGRVVDVWWLGTRTEIRVEVAPGVVIEADGAALAGAAEGARVLVRIARAQVRVWRPPSDASAVPAAVTALP